MTPYGTYSARSIGEIVDASIQLHLSFSKQEGIICDRIAY